MVAFRSSYRPPRRTPPLKNGFVLRALEWTSATSNVGAGLVDWAKAAPARRATKLMPANARIIANLLRRYLDGPSRGWVLLWAFRHHPGLDGRRKKRYCRDG